MIEDDHGDHNNSLNRYNVGKILVNQAHEDNNLSLLTSVSREGIFY
jgi:hypothetical protein